jgi:RNA polymerase sigma-70 factor (ECF subfamily)
MTLQERAPSLDGPADRERAFNALFRGHYAGLCRFLAHLLGSLAQAEEVVQDLFMYVWTHHEAIDETTPSRAYLYRAAHNAALNRLRHQRVEQQWAVRQPLTLMVPATAPDELARDELAVVVQEAIRALPEKCRLIYRMSREEELTYQEIALALGLSVKTVEAQMARAFRHLRVAVGPHLLGGAMLIAAIGGRALAGT